MTRDGTLVGRERELGEIRAGLERAAGGGGGLFLLVGEPGIGKTRVCDAAAEAAREAGFDVAWGRCWEGEAPPAYLPWAEVLRALPVAPTAPALAPILPELGPAVPGGEAAGFVLLEATLALLAAAAARRPQLLVLDDLHAADIGSLRLLEFVVRALRGRALLILGAYRDVEARLSPEAARRLARIAREGRALPLARLGETETASLAAVTAGRALAPAVVREVQRVTEGNPLFVAETVALLASRGELDRPPRDGTPIPVGVDAVIAGRLDRLSPPARRALEVGSVLGREFDVALASALCAAEGIADPGAALAEAEALGFGAVARDRFRLSHALVREAIHRSLPLADARALHLAASHAFERAAGALDNAGFEAAHHALVALPAGDPARAVALGMRAAEELAARLAFEVAAEMYQRVLRALPVVPADPLRRCDLLIALARCLSSAGAIADSKARALEAAALARAAEDWARLAAAALAYGAQLRIGVVDPELVALLEEALAEAPAAMPARPVVMARLAAARQPADDPTGPIALAREALALARARSDPAVLVSTLHNGLSAMVDYVPAAELLPLFLELRGLAEARGDRALAFQATVRAFVTRLERGDVAGADAELERLDWAARELAHPRYRWRPLLMKAMRADMIGLDGDAARLRAEAIALADGAEDPNLPLVHAFQGLLMSASAGHIDDMVRDGERVAALFANVAAVGLWRSLIIVLGLVRSGRLDDARTEWARLPTGHPMLTSEAATMTLVGAIAAALGDTAAMALIEPKLRGWTGHTATMGQMGLFWFGPVERTLGLIAAARGATVEAATWLEDARARARAAGAAPLVGRIERELAALATNPSAPAPATASGATAATPLTMVREGDVWALRLGARTVRLKATRGLAMLARLVAEPGRELHVLDLAEGAGNDGRDGDAAMLSADVKADATASGLAVGRGLGDAGPLLDARARAAYRARYEALEETLAAAEAAGDLGRAAAARRERELLADELARAVGLGGRDRHAASAAERARVNVQRRLKDAIDRAAAADPALGRHLSRALKTGAFCSYVPD